MVFLSGPRSVLTNLRWTASTYLPVLGIGVAIGLLVAGGLAAFSARQDAWGLAVQQSNNLRLALARDIGRNIMLLDLSLQGVIEALAQPGIETTPRGIRQQALFDRAAGAEDLGSIIVLGPKGEVTDSSTSLPPGLNFAGRSEFVVARQQPDLGMFLSRASPGWSGDTRPSISISRRLPLRDGQFAGIVTGSLYLSYFQHLFEKIDIGPKGSITLLRTDGHIVWRYPTASGDIDRDLGSSDSYHEMMAVSDGRFVGHSIVDHVTRLYSFGRVGTLPLILSVNFAEDDIYKRWKQKASIIGPVLVSMSVAIVILSLMFRKEMIRRSAAEQALALMAATDALTGVANRRSFEDGLRREWRRALREHTELSLLMIDVDHFKNFNDRYGHLEGDRALKLIAAAITANLLRPADLVARYGGEEFVILLPTCGAAGASLIAERIRNAIEGIGVIDANNTAGCVTISVGVATTMPSPQVPAFDLVKAADDELYAAKAKGRNQVSAPAAPGDRESRARFGLKRRDQPRLIA